MGRARRIVKSKYAANAFDGEGARLYGGRWSSPGTRVVYVAESLSLPPLEILVHLQAPAVLFEYVVFTVDFPDECVQSVAQKNLAEIWRAFPTAPENQAIGDQWAVAGSSLLLQVPSAVTPNEFNYLISPVHADFSRRIISRPQPLDVDPRIFRR